LARQIATIQNKTANPARMSFAALTDAAKAAALKHQRRKDISPLPYGSKPGLGRRIGYQAIGHKVLGTRDLHRSHAL